jgi:hypothetical protein
MHQTKLVLDAFGEAPLDGFVTTETWNSFACPLFTFEQAQNVAEASNASGLLARYEGTLDAFVAP